MKNKILALVLLTTFACARLVVAQDEPKIPAELRQLVDGLKYQQGEITLRGGIAKLTVPKEFNYLSPDDAETVLVKIWGNPPGGKSLGLLMPAGLTPLSTNGWAVTIDFTEDGHVKDDDAGKINYTKLLKEMQDSAHEASKERAKEGYPTVALVGWAAPPRYDAATHKLYWAKELQFGDEKEHTLNYNIRMLGRHGVLVLNVIASLPQLAEVEKEAPQILAMVNFNEGHRYADFDSKTDKVATYGIAALVAGGIATKLGFFKLIWVFLLAAKKFIIIGCIAIFAAVKKFLGRSKNTPA
jgi:uncharacterized membrane-anchored protein